MDSLQTEITEAVLRELPGSRLRGFRRVARICSQIASRRRVLVPRLQGEDAEAYLRACIERVHGEGLDLGETEPWSRYEWLFYLRRVSDDPFLGALATTAPYDRSLCEILVLSKAPDFPLQGFRGGVFPFSTRHARILADAIAFAQAASQLHVCYRLAGKGTPVVLSRRLSGIHEPFPVAERTADIDRATRHYDERVAREGGHGRLGVMHESARAKSGGGNSNPAFFTVHLIDPQLIPFPLGEPTGEIFARFRPSTWDMSSLRAMAEEQDLRFRGAWHDDLPGLAALLTFGAVLFELGGAGQQANLLRCGYIILDTRLMREAWLETRNIVVRSVSAALGEVFGGEVGSILDIVAEAARWQGKPWPQRPGPVVFTAGENMTGIDLWGATNRFFALLEYPVEQGQGANVRAGIFESQIQEQIDGSAWAPSPRTRVLKGRHLRLNDQVIGELDAVGQQGNVLLAVSCKSIAYTQHYDVGQYNVVRNVRTHLENAVAELDALVSILQANPRGQNYDLGEFSAVISVVVTPHVYYVTDPLISEEAAPGLLKYSTSLELAHWLSGQGRAS